MRAIIEMSEGKTIEVVGRDLDIKCGLIPPMVYVVDKADDERQLFYAAPDKVKCSYIQTGDMELLRIGGGDQE